MIKTVIGLALILIVGPIVATYFFAVGADLASLAACVLITTTGAVILDRATD